MRKETEREVEHAVHSKNHFNVYQLSHPCEFKGWGFIRSLFKQLKVKRKMNSYLNTPEKFYYYINRMGVKKKRKEAV